MFNACSKQETSEPASSTEQPEITGADQLVLNKIKSFKQKMNYIHEHPGYKSGETMSVDSAKWYLDAVFNYSYAYTEQSFESLNRGTFTLTLEKNGERIDFEEVCEAFNELKQKTLLIYYDTEGEEKELYVSSMHILEDTGSEVLIEVSATIGTDGNNTPEPPGFIQWGPFVDGDDWMYGELLGDCDGGSWGLTDAAVKMDTAINKYRYKYIQDEGLGWYAYYTGPSAEVDVTVYLDPQNDSLFRNPNDATIDNDRDYLIHYQKKDVANNLLIETCINWEDMNFYYHGTRKVIYQIIQENYDVFGISDDLTFYSCEIEGKGEGWDDYDPDYAYHTIKPEYKTRHITWIDERSSIGVEE
jgi:hypothetical protein